jgi:DNA-binding NarL/FixJ family response regulator
MDQRVQVLIVDHEVHTCQGLQALLAAWPQIEVVGAANGAEAVQLMEKCQPDVALMDIPRPVPARSRGPERSKRSAEGMDGLEVIRLIKSRWPQVRMVVLTMYSTHRAAALAAGADAFLLKGCPAQDLLNAIASHASHPSGQG